MAHIMISYSRKDSDTVGRYVALLREAGVNVWQDVLGETAGIPFSVNWINAIEDAVYRAGGAIIFRSVSWSNSKPCAAEFRMINSVSLPYRIVDLPSEAPVEEEAQALAAWCAEIGKDEKNNRRLWMYANCYRLSRGLAPDIPQVRRMKEAVCYCRDLKAYAAQAQEEGYREKNDLIPLYLQKLLKKARGRTVGRQVVRIGLLLLCVAALAVTAVGGYRAYQMITADNDDIDARYETSYYRKIGAYHPLQMAVEIMCSDRFYHSQLTEVLLNDFLSQCYPSEFYLSDTPEAAAIAKEEGIKTSERYDLFTDTYDSRIFLRDNRTGSIRQILLDGTIGDCSFSEDGRYLVCSAYQRAYILALGSDYDPKILTCNNEIISRVLMKDNRIYAVCDSGSVVVWENPYLEKTFYDRRIESGCIGVDQDGAYIAAYIDAKKLVLNRNNTETAVIVEGYDADYTCIPALSPDGDRVAAIYLSSEGGGQHLVIIDTITARPVLTVSLDSSAASVTIAFTGDGSAVIMTDDLKNAVIRIDAVTGETKEAYVEDVLSLYGVYCTEDRIYTVNERSRLRIFDNELNLIKECGAINPYYAVVKQFVADEKNGYIYSAYRGSNLLTKAFCMSLSEDHDSVFFPPIENGDVFSTSAVAASADNSFFAYGYPNGTLDIYNRCFSLVYENRSVPDGILSMIFAPDNTAIYLLGDSGTVYRLNLTDTALGCPADVDSNYQQMNYLAGQLLAICDRLKEIHLSSMDVEQLLTWLAEAKAEYE